MEPTFEELIVKSKESYWNLRFGYTFLAVVDNEGSDYVIGKTDWIDKDGGEHHGKLGPMTLAEVLAMDFSQSLIEKIKSIEEVRALDHNCFFIFGIHALFALLAEGLVIGTLAERSGGVFDGTIELDEKKYAFSVVEAARPAENCDFLLADGSQNPCIIL